MKNKSSGFTLVEILIVAVIIGIVAAVGIPIQRNAVKQTQASDSAAALISIHQAEKAYKASHGQYYPPSTMLSPASNAAQINKDLSLALDDRYYTFEIYAITQKETVGTVGYVAKALPHADGSKTPGYITYDNKGCFGGSNDYVPANATACTPTSLPLAGRGEGKVGGLKG